MNSNGKIIFGGFIAVSAVVVLLLFSMQNSAQLKLDIEDVKHTVAEKEAAIDAINSELDTAQSKTKTAEVKNQLIPELRSSLETTEQEKLVYIQQLDDFQAELQKQVDIAAKRLSEITSLQKQQEDQQQLLTEKQIEHQQLLADSNETITTADQQKTELNTALMSTLAELELQKHALEQTLDTLGQKDRVIQIYKEKLDKSAEEIMMLHTVDSSEQLNLKLVLDELAVKNQFVQNLPSNCKPSDDPAAEKADTPEAKSPSVLSNESDQALIVKLSLANDNLDTELNIQQETIANLQSKIAASDELSSSYATESEQLLLTGKAREDEIRLLKHKINGLEASLTAINDTIANKEQAVKAAREQTQGIAAPLTEKISGLELQLSQLANRQAAVTNELSESRTTITTLQNDKQIISDELNSTETALATLQEQTDKLVEELKTANATLDSQQSQATELNATIKSKRIALSKESKSNKALNKEVVTLKNSLQISKDDVTRLNNLSSSFDKRMQDSTASQIQMSTTINKLENSISEREAAIQKLEGEYKVRTAQFMEVRDRLSTAGNIKLHDMDTIHKHEARIARLIEEITEYENSNKKMRTRNKELLDALNEKQPEPPVVEEKPAPEAVPEEVTKEEVPQEEAVQEEAIKEDAAQETPEAEENM